MVCKWGNSIDTFLTDVETLKRHQSTLYQDVAYIWKTIIVVFQFDIKWKHIDLGLSNEIKENKLLCIISYLSKLVEFSNTE